MRPFLAARRTRLATLLKCCGYGKKSRVRILGNIEKRCEVILGKSEQSIKYLGSSPLEHTTWRPFQYHNMFEQHTRDISTSLLLLSHSAHTTFPFPNSLLPFLATYSRPSCRPFVSSCSVLDSRRRLHNSLSASSQDSCRICLVVCLCSFRVSRRLSRSFVFALFRPRLRCPISAGTAADEGSRFGV